MSSILEHQSNQLTIPFSNRKYIEALLAHQPVGQLIELFCPSEKSQQLPKWKWALVFQNSNVLQQFIAEIDSNEDKQQKLAMDNYSVFANVMFVFMRRQMKLNIWAQHVSTWVDTKPIGIFIFNLRYKQLAQFIDSNIQIHYKVIWDQMFEIKKLSTKNQLSGKGEQSRDDSSESESYKNVKRKATKSSNIETQVKKFVKAEKIKVKTEQQSQSQAKEVIYLEEDDKQQMANKSTEDSTIDHRRPKYKSLTQKIKLNSLDLLGKINEIAECLSKLIDSINTFQEYRY